MARINRRNIEGSVMGLAIGDAWGNRTEFFPYDHIVARHGLQGPEFRLPGRITDDTQMSLYLIQALRKYHTASWKTLLSRGNYPLNDLTTKRLASCIGEAFIEWLFDPDNDRAPGGTCLRSLRGLNARSLSDYMDTTDHDSKGCGANMRVPWAGLDMRIPDDSLEDVAELQSIITHGHPTALAASSVTAILTRKIAYGEVQRGSYTEAALDIAQSINRHNDEVIDVLKVARNALHTFGTEDVWNHDPCERVGQGWIAEQALAVATYVSDLTAQEAPSTALRRAITSGGDSDSIGCLVGAFVGASGVDWTQEGTFTLEPRYEKELAEAVNYLDTDKFNWYA